MKNKELRSVWGDVHRRVGGAFCFRDATAIALPVEHAVRGVCFERSIDSRAFYASVFVQPLCVPTEHMTLSVGWRLGGGSRLWRADEPGMVDDLAAMIEREALPFLERGSTPLGVAECAQSLPLHGDLNVVQAIGYSFARAGEYGRAIESLERFLEMIGDCFRWERTRRANAGLLKSLVLSDPDLAQQQLFEWERSTAKNLGLESLRGSGGIGQ